MRLWQKDHRQDRNLFSEKRIEIYEDGSAHLTSSKVWRDRLFLINEGLRILIEEALVPVDTAINSCTKNPATCLKIDDRKGSIKWDWMRDALLFLTVIIVVLGDILHGKSNVR